MVMVSAGGWSPRISLEEGALENGNPKRAATTDAEKGPDQEPPRRTRGGVGRVTLKEAKKATPKGSPFRLPKDAASGRIESCFVIDLDEARKRLRGGHIPPKHPPKILATLDLAERWQARLDAGGVNRADLAREHQVSRARVTQVLKLLNLHPTILRWVREHPRAGSEHRLRPLLDLSPRAQLLEAEGALAGFATRDTA